MARDDFPKPVIDKLRTRVANRCSNPDCRVPTTGPAGSNKINNIGIAAHICAAAAGGPRYADDMTSAERKSFNNGIWLCTICAKKIDSDVDRYPEALLQRWKMQAEATAEQELGKPLPNAKDAITTLSGAMTGLPTEFVPSAISNVHQSSALTLEALDPRFHVETEYKGRATTFHLHAKEDIPVTMTISSTHVDEFRAKYDNLVRHGDDLSIDANSLSFVGSRLIEEITKPTGGQVQILSPKKDVLLRLSSVSRSTNISFQLDDVHAKASVGSESYTILGHTCGGLLHIQQSGRFDRKDVNVDLRLEYQAWENCDIRMLPHFDKLHRFFDSLLSDSELFIEVEIDGFHLSKTSGIDVSDQDFVAQILSIFEYVRDSRKIADLTEHAILFKPEFTVSQEEYEDIKEACRIIDGQARYTKRALASPIRTKLTLHRDMDSTHPFMSDKASYLVLEEDTRKRIRVFDEEIQLPRKRLKLSSVHPRLDENAKTAKTGDMIDVEWEPAEDFSVEIQFAP